MFDESLRKTAQQLVDLCNAHKEAEALDTLYAPDAVSVEALAMPGSNGPEAVGLAAIKGKHAWWNGAFELHASYADGPYLHGANRFAVKFVADTTNRETGQRSKMQEIGIYTVQDGKIVREEFFYAA